MSLAGPRRLDAAVESVLGRRIALTESGVQTFAGARNASEVHSYTIGTLDATPKYSCDGCALDPEYQEELRLMNITHWAAEGTGRA